MSAYVGERCAFFECEERPGQGYVIVGPCGESVTGRAQGLPACAKHVAAVAPWKCYGCDTVNAGDQPTCWRCNGLRRT